MPESKRKRGSSSSSEDSEARRINEETRKRRRAAHEARKAERKQKKAQEKEQLRLAAMSPEDRRKYERALELQKLEDEIQRRKHETELRQKAKRQLQEAEEEKYLQARLQWEKSNKKWSLDEDSDDPPEEEEQEQQEQDEEDSEEDPYQVFLQSMQKADIDLTDKARKTVALDEIQHVQTQNKQNGVEDEKSAASFIAALKDLKPMDPEEAAKKRLKEEQNLKELEDEKLLKETGTQGSQQLDFDEAEFKERSYNLKNQEAHVKDLKPVDHSKIDYAPFRKAFYIEAEALKKLSPQEVKERRRELDKIKIKGENIPAPVGRWEHCGLSDQLLDTLKEVGYVEPLPIQAQAMPVIMSGRDVLAVARTGSGKTLAYLLPMLRHILDQPDIQEFEGPIAWVIVPTHELALQIDKEAKKLGKALNIRSLAAYGGVPISEQIAECRRRIHIVIGTPGRLVDLMVANKGRVLNTLRGTFVVLDEADRMFDMGFGPQVAKIVTNIRPDRQTIMVSATMPKQIEVAAKKFLQNPAEVVIGGRCTASTNVTQFVECFESADHKFLRLLQLVGEWYEKGLMLIFSETQEEVDELWQSFYSNGYNNHCITLHGGMDQIDRDLALHDFHMKGKRILIATSIASRGIDVPDLELVINYRIPSHIEDYIHRIGRTGRAKKRGTAFSFYTIGEDERHATWLVRALETSNNQVPEELQIIANAFWEKRKSGLVTDWRPNGGFSGRGYKFDSKEARKKKEEIKAQMAARGLVAEDSDDGASSASDDHINVDVDKQRPVNHTTEGGALVVHPMARVQRAQDYAKNLSLAIAEADAMAAQNKFTAEVEINDYPASARWKVTNREQCAAIIEGFEATVMVKGVYCAKKPVPGERKLYLQIDGPSDADVQGAKKAIVDILESETARSLAAASSIGVGRAIKR